MNDWQGQVWEALHDFEIVSGLALEPTSLSELKINFLEAPHLPNVLKKRWMAIYGFWWNGEWLKIGKVGPSSGARFKIQHYSVDAARYTFARSLVTDPAMAMTGVREEPDPGDWIRSNVNRVEIMLPPEKSRELLSLLELFLHVRLKPRYEGAGYWKSLQ